MADRSGIEAFLYLLDEAFGGPGLEASGESQALLPNLATVPEAWWRARPERAVRTIEAITLHVGSCKVMYDDYAFGAGSLTWLDPEVQPWPDGEAPMTETIRWLTGAHERLVEHVSALPDDDALEAARPTNWGERRPTRWIVAALITHDAYHAGEINHLRSLLRGDDRWRHVQLGFG